ncbi:hypothetical protein EJ08DRAFT_589743, partial [Tothia fuscella]
IYSLYYNTVSNLLKSHDLFFEFNNEDDSDCEEEHDTNIIGRFRYRNRSYRTCS